LSRQALHPPDRRRSQHRPPLSRLIHPPLRQHQSRQARPRSHPCRS
jgi:hypothetical protein